MRPESLWTTALTDQCLGLSQPFLLRNIFLLRICYRAFTMQNPGPETWMSSSICLYYYQQQHTQWMPQGMYTALLILSSCLPTSATSHSMEPHLPCSFLLSQANLIPNGANVVHLPKKEQRKIKKLSFTKVKQKITTATHSVLSTCSTSVLWCLFNERNQWYCWGFHILASHLIHFSALVTDSISSHDSFLLF